MRFNTFYLLLFTLTPTWSQQPIIEKNNQPSAELLEFLAEFNMQTEHDDKDYDIIKHHALQDQNNAPLQEQNNDKQ